MILTSVSSGYILASIIQSLNLFGKLNFPKALLRPISLCVLLGHGFLLYKLIELDGGQNLDALLMLSMTLWFMGLFIFLSFNQALGKLNSFVYLLAGISLPIAYSTHGEHVVSTHSPIMLFHILISFMATSVLLLAFFHAFILSFQNYLLKKNMNHPLLKALPPLNHMEQLLFIIIGGGFALLTLSLLSGLAHPEQLITARNLPKTFLATLAWCMFLGILWARLKKGLRGRSAHRLTLISGGLLFLSYFGTQFFLA